MTRNGQTQAAGRSWRRATGGSLAGLGIAALLAPGAGCLGEDSRSDPPPELLRSGFFIDPAKSVLIRDLHIVEDPTRTADPCVSSAPAGPALDSQKWTFGYLMTQMANGRDPALFAHQWLANWSLSTTVNGDPVTTRRGATGKTLPGKIYDAWQRASGGVDGGPVALKMNKAPFRLLAIVNRFDLRNDPLPNKGTAGELRFVFSVLDLDHADDTFTGCEQHVSDQDAPLPGTELLILEFAVDKADDTSKRNWIVSWTNLTNYDFADPAYGTALSQLTEQVVRAGAGGSRAGGSALLRIRTNETVDDAIWQMREFTIDPTTLYLTPATVKQTPRDGLQGDPTLGSWINTNSPGILAGNYVLPSQFVGGYAETIANHSLWLFSNVSNNDLRHAFSQGTCNGCHAKETGSNFFHVRGRHSQTVSEISGFLGGDGQGGPYCADDPGNPAGPQRCFYELGRRVDDILAYLNGGP